MPLSPVPQRAASGEGLVCALTFDDGPNGVDTMRLLDGLRERGIRAVFCVVGECIQAPASDVAPSGAEILRQMVADGHVLANHSTGFADMGEWSADAVRADLLENLRIIRQALDDPSAAVPFWRAPNGSWGTTCEVAVELGMQPLDVVHHIHDWDEQDPGVLAGRLRAEMTPGELVLVHDGGGGRSGSVDAVLRVVDERLAEGWRFTLPASS